MGCSVVELTAELEALDDLGGKGKALAALVNWGFPVPTTAVVATPAYREVASAPEVAALIGRISAGENVRAAEVDDIFTRAAAASPVAANAANEIGRIAAGARLAMRSSATVEDLHGSSFAGQYRSLLDVPSDDGDEVVQALAAVWASLWHPAPTAYRRAFGIDESNVAMAVVAMVMVPATTAGVVFTVDPGGEPGAARVEAVEGLGESLVSGARTPSAWVVPRDDHDDLPGPAARALELAIEAEEAFGVPQDVEWAAEAEQVYLVQSRPITVEPDNDGFDSPVDEHELTTAGIAETVPGVVPALHWTHHRFLLEEALRSVLDSLGLLIGDGDEDRPLIRRVRGRVAVDFDQLRQVAASTPGAVEELERQYFGEASKENRATAGDVGRVGRWARQLRTLRTRGRVVEQADIVIHAASTFRRNRPLVTELSDADIVAWIRRLVDLAGRGLAAELGVAAAGGATVARLMAQLEPHLGHAEAEQATLELLGDIRRPERQPWASAGSFAGPTWSELGGVPETVVSPTEVTERRTEKRVRLEERLRSTPGWRRRRILTGQVVDVRLHLIRRTIVDGFEMLERREAAKAAVLELGGEVRRLERELGRRLVARGVLSHPDEVELLSWPELLEAIEPGVGTEQVPGPDVIRRRRSWLARYRVEGELPLRFRGEPERTPEPMPEGDVLEGWAASAGRAEGLARVVAEADGRFEEGEVLVATATDASWSPLFVKAAAVVVERGGPLSHAAILARELGLPAVLNVTGACSVLDGAVVSVDGSEGKVVVVDREGVTT